MALPAGTRLGVYEIVGPLGAGGMGEVHRARDTRLNRDVAVKVPSGVFAGDPERLSRIEREAQILASLNHANIAHLHGVEESSAGPALDEKLKRMDIDGGSALTLTSNAGVPLGGTWNRDGTILFANNPGGPILRISDRGGPATPATSLDPGRQRGHYFPHFLPDGRHFLFLVSSPRPDVRGVYVGELDGSPATRLFDAGPAVYAATGHLRFVRGGKIFAQGFDADQQRLDGEPFIVEEQATGSIRLAASAAGPIAYRSGSSDVAQRQLAWIDRGGRELDKVIYDDTAAQGPALSNDGRRIAVYRYANSNMDLWSYDIKRKAWDKITFDPGDDIYPLWSPGDTSIVFGAVPITMAPDAKALEPGAPSSLFTTRVGSTAALRYRQQYVVSADGQSFVMNSVVTEPTSSPITVVLNWKPRR